MTERERLERELQTALILLIEHLESSGELVRDRPRADPEWHKSRFALGDNGFSIFWDFAGLPARLDVGEPQEPEEIDDADWWKND